MSRARESRKRERTKGKLAEVKADFSVGFGWGMRKYRIHCHACGELSMKLRSEIDLVLLRGAMPRFFYRRNVLERKNHDKNTKNFALVYRCRYRRTSYRRRRDGRCVANDQLPRLS